MEDGGIGQNWEGREREAANGGRPEEMESALKGLVYKGKERMYKSAVFFSAG